MLSSAEIQAIARALARELQGVAPSSFAHRLDDLAGLKLSQSNKCRAIAAERRKQLAA